MKYIALCCLAICFFLTDTAGAELRIWTDKNGNAVEAEYDSMYGSKVVLKTADGRTLKVPAEGLCDDDQEYLSHVAAVPPKLVIKVDEDMESDKNSAGYTETLVEMLTLGITVRKRNPEPCMERFKTELYILGREAKGNQFYSIIDVVNHEATFVQSDEVTFTEKFTIKSEIGYSWSNGYEYEGYLFLVKNSAGDVVVMESNQNILERNLTQLMKSKKGYVYNEDFIKVD